MRNAIKQAVLLGSKHSGLFSIGGHISKHGLRILCYHGTALAEEHHFLPKLFMSPSTFERRLSVLAERRYTVLRLAEAVERLVRGDLPPRAIVLTIDDGFYGTYRLAWPMLVRYGFPATIYSTSYYTVKQHPVFGLVVEYMLWKTQVTVLDLDALGTRLHGRYSLDSPTLRRQVADTIGEYGETQCSEEERVAIAQRLGGLLDIHYETLAKSRMLSLMTLDEIRELALAGADIQAHTHRHRFPAREGEAQRELSDNRRALEPALGYRLEHFCYPSGEWFEEQWSWLETEGIKTATTCEKGLNYPDTPRFALRRFLDGEHISAIEFEAEVSGYMELLRRVRAGLGGGRPARPWRNAAV